MDTITLDSGVQLPGSVYRAYAKALSDSMSYAGMNSMGNNRGWSRPAAVLSGGNQRFHDSRLRDYESYLNAVTIPWVYQAGSTVAWSYAVSEFSITEGRSGPSVDEGADGLEELMQLMDQPNPWRDSYHFREELCWHLILTGNAFMVMDNLDGLGRPTELYLLRPSYVRIRPDPKRYIASFWYEVNGMHIPFSPEEVIWFKRANPRDQYWGMGVIEPGEGTFNKQRNISRTENAFFDAGARVKGVLTYDGLLSEDQEGALQQAWRQMDEGQAGEFKTAILQAGMTYQPIASDLLENGPGMESLSKMARDEILTLFGVPKQKVGIFEDANYRSIEADSFFQAETMRPLLRGTNFAWTNLVQRFDPAWRYKHAEIAVTDYYDKAMTSHYFSQSGTMMMNEIRRVTGTDPLPEDDERGEMIVIPTSMALLRKDGTVISIDPQPTPAEGAAAPDDSPPPAKTGTKARCGCPPDVQVRHKADRATDLGICPQHAQAVDRVLEEGRRRQYSLRQMTDGFDKEKYPGVAGMIRAA